jgi:hypothetical protein
MTSTIRSFIQRYFLSRFDAALVRASWLERYSSDITTRSAKAEASYNQLVETHAAFVARSARDQAGLAASHRQLLSKYETMTARCAQAEIGHAELTAAHRKLLSEYEAMTARCAQAEAGHADLTAAHQSVGRAIGNVDSTVQLLGRQVETLAEAVNGSVRNFLYAADLRPGPPFETAQGIRRIGRLLRPKEALGPPKIRVGGDGDGGYIMLDDFEGTQIAYSIGIGDNVSWDLSLARRNIRIHQFDHTIDRPPISHPNFCFHRRKMAIIADEDNEDLRSMLRFADDASMTSKPVLKIDIEHDEWDILDQVDPTVLRGFSQIVCELHWFGRGVSGDWLEKAERVLQKMNEDFQVVHVHGNNCAPYSLIAGVPMPSVLEVTYCNRSDYEFKYTQELFPGLLDSPNNAAAPDLFLGSFQF